MMCECVCVRAERSGSVKECMFFGDVAVLCRSSVSVCACIQASSVVNEALLGLLIMFNQWWERQLISGAQTIVFSLL